MAALIFDKVYFPQIISINEPGIVMSRGSDWYGKSFRKKRSIYLFEKAFCDLQSGIIKKEGKKKAQEIFYRIGKDTGTRLLLLAHMDKSNEAILLPKLKIILFMLSFFGFRINEKVGYNKTKKEFFFSGKDNIFCTKTNEQGFSAGVISGIVSILSGENIEAEKISCSFSGKDCCIVAGKKLKAKYIPDFKKIAPDDNYYRHNFIQESPIEFNKNEYAALKDLITANILETKKNSLMYFGKEHVTINEIGAANLIFYHMNEYGLLDFSRKCIQNSHREITKPFLSSIKTKKERINAIKKITSGFGWGIPKFSWQEEKIKIIIEKFPYSQFEDSCITSGITGMAENALSSNLAIEKIEQVGNRCILLLKKVI
ncbi:MAG: hypothetical protein V1859_01745 [archaeon]